MEVLNLDCERVEISRETPRCDISDKKKTFFFEFELYLLQNESFEFYVNWEKTMKEQFTIQITS